MSKPPPLELTGNVPIKDQFETNRNETVKHLKHEELHVFDLNMIRLADMLPQMSLTVDERRTLRELVETYFQKKAPPPLPWTQRQTDKVVRRRGKAG